MPEVVGVSDGEGVTVGVNVGIDDGDGVIVDVGLSVGLTDLVEIGVADSLSNNSPGIMIVAVPCSDR